MTNHCKLLHLVLGSLLILIAFSEQAISEDFWNKQNTPTSVNLFECTFVDSLNGWACGDSGRIIHTSNGGLNWVIQATPVDYYLEDIFFINQNTGWAIGNEFFFVGSTILTTTNGGINWNESTFFDTTVVLSAVLFTDPLNGWLGSYYGKIYKTSNGGVNWTLCPTDSGMFSGFRIKRFKFYSPGYGFACGGQVDIAGVIWKTVNNGGLWTSQAISPEPLFDVVFLDSLNAIGVGGDFEYGTFITRTSNGGINWDYTSLNLFGQGHALAFRTDTNIWIPLGFSQTWAVSFDGGKHWSEEPVSQNLALKDALFTDPLHGWAVGDSGLVVKFNPMSVGVNTNYTYLPGDYSLSQNYPNPFNPSTTIEYSLKKPTLVKIIVYDITGKQMDVFNLGKKTEGTHKLNFKASKYNSGVYYYRLIIGDFSETKKMVIIK